MYLLHVCILDFSIERCHFLGARQKHAPKRWRAGDDFGRESSLRTRHSPDQPMQRDVADSWPWSLQAARIISGEGWDQQQCTNLPTSSPWFVKRPSSCLLPCVGHRQPVHYHLANCGHVQWTSGHYAIEDVCQQVQHQHLATLQCWQNSEGPWRERS